MGLYYLLGLLNSKLFGFLYPQISKEESGRTFSQVKTTYIKKLPLVSEYNSTIANIVSYLLLINNSKTSSLSNAINKEFIEVIDALTLELYFREEFNIANLTIETLAKEMFIPINHLGDEEKLDFIKAVYEVLREKKNPLRNQIKLMKIDLNDLLLPILSI